jgi:hypothetical protein
MGFVSLQLDPIQTVHLCSPKCPLVNFPCVLHGNREEASICRMLFKIFDNFTVHIFSADILARVKDAVNFGQLSACFALIDVSHGSA